MVVSAIFLLNIGVHVDLVIVVIRFMRSEPI